MKTYEVIYLEPELPSFSWMKGLYFVYKTVGDEVYLGKINSKGTVDYYEENMNINGGYDISITSKKNKGIIPTRLTITL
jgi:hypothetical protein